MRIAPTDPRAVALKKAMADRMRQIYVMWRMAGIKNGLVPERRTKVRL